MAKITPNASSTRTSAKPTSAPADKGKKEKVEKKAFPLVGSKDASVYPFKTRLVVVKNEDGSDRVGADGQTMKLEIATPEGYDPKIHESIGPKDFEKRSAFFLYKAEEAERRALAYRERAKGNAGGGAGKANRLLKMMQKANDLRAELAAQGIDVDALLAQTKPADATKGGKDEAQKA